jgi:hypothetical protein
MKKRPLSVTIIGWLFIVTGVVGIAYHSTEIRTSRPLEYVPILFVRLLAIVGGGFLLRGHNWARWLVLAWLAYHVGLSYFHTPAEMVMHALLLVVIGWLLLRRNASRFFATSAPQAG